jgi:hypothetical protein
MRPLPPVRIYSNIYNFSGILYKKQQIKNMKEASALGMQDIHQIDNLLSQGID